MANFWDTNISDMSWLQSKPLEEQKQQQQALNQQGAAGMAHTATQSRALKQQGEFQQGELSIRKQLADQQGDYQKAMLKIQERRLALLEQQSISADGLIKKFQSNFGSDLPQSISGALGLIYGDEAGQESASGDQPGQESDGGLGDESGME
jgi:hypothetical protein